MINGAVPDLAGLIRPGDTIMWGQANAEPLTLTRALVDQRHRFGRVRLFLGALQTSTLQAQHADAFDFLAYCGAGQNRNLARAGVLDILPSHYSELPSLMRTRVLRVDVLLLQLSPPDVAGRYSLGLANEYLIAALETARVVIAEVNDQVPWTYGERALVDADLDLIVHVSYPPVENPVARITEVERAIGANVASLIEDGATLQLGLGAIPEAVLTELGDRRDLGIHSGAVGDKVAELMQAGAVTNTRKTIDQGVTIGGVLMGSRRLHRFAHRNPALQLRGTAYTHDAGVLQSIDRLIAINSAVEVDLTGQINSEVAGAVDFLRGAVRSRNGAPVVALPSTSGERSRIVAALSGPVSTSRSDAGFIVTEYGLADLRGQSLSQRTERLLAIAHPDHRAALARDACKRGVKSSRGNAAVY